MVQESIQVEKETRFQNMGLGQLLSNSSEGSPKWQSEDSNKEQN